MANNNELTARQVHALLLKRWPHLAIMLTTIKNLGWVATKPKYLEKRTSKIGWIGWYRNRLANNDMFDNIHRRMQCTAR